MGLPDDRNARIDTDYSDKARADHLNAAIDKIRRRKKGGSEDPPFGCGTYRLEAHVEGELQCAWTVGRGRIAQGVEGGF